MTSGANIQHSPRCQDSKIPRFESWNLGNLRWNLGRQLAQLAHVLKVEQHEQVGEQVGSPLFTSGHLSCYIGGKPRGLVCRNTLQTAVATSTVKRGFVSSKFWGLVRLYAPPLMVMGEMGLGYPNSKDRGRSLSVRTPARLFACYEHLVHLMSVVRQQVSSLIQTGIQTMTAINQQAIRAAAPSPTKGTSDPVQLHAQAHNAMAMALHYLSQPQANVAGARRKAIQALSALRGLDLTLEA